jgi:hypothetical protein
MLKGGHDRLNSATVGIQPLIRLRRKECSVYKLIPKFWIFTVRPSLRFRYVFDGED